MYIVWKSAVNQFLNHSEVRMSSPFSFGPMLMFGGLAAMLLVGTLFRARVRFFQSYLIPSCLIGGILGLTLVSAGLIPLAAADLENAAYHFFNISFISIGLTADTVNGSARPKGENRLHGPLWMALTQSAIFPLQALCGGALVMLLGLAGLKLFPTFGFFLPLGFEEGPGQALSFGKVWEGIGFENAATIGLTFATIGFFFAFFVGVPLVNWGIRRGLASGSTGELPQHVRAGVMPPGAGREEAGRLPFHSGNVESLAYQSSLIGLVYVLTYAVIKLLGTVLPADVASMLWAFFFILGLGLAFVVRWALQRFGIAHTVDPGIQRRITGWSVDFLIVATIMAIKLTVVRQYIVPIGIMAAVGGVVTTALVIYLGNRLGAYNLERTAAVYGAVTGTVSCGLLLLRIVDPEFKTPVSIEMAVMNVFSIPIIGICTVLVNGPIWWDWSLGLTLLVFAVVMVVALGLIRVLKLIGAPKI